MEKPPIHENLRVVSESSCDTKSSYLCNLYLYYFVIHYFHLRYSIIVTGFEVFENPTLVASTLTESTELDHAFLDREKEIFDIFENYEDNYAKSEVHDRLNFVHINQEFGLGKVMFHSHYSLIANFV